MQITTKLEQFYHFLSLKTASQFIRRNLSIPNLNFIFRSYHIHPLVNHTVKHYRVITLNDRSTYNAWVLMLLL